MSRPHYYPLDSDLRMRRVPRMRDGMGRNEMRMMMVEMSVMRRLLVAAGLVCHRVWCHGEATTEWRVVQAACCVVSMVGLVQLGAVARLA